MFTWPLLGKKCHRHKEGKCPASNHNALEMKALLKLDMTKRDEKKGSKRESTNSVITGEEDDEDEEEIDIYSSSN